jgi:hypothetical protein
MVAKVGKANPRPATKTGFSANRELPPPGNYPIAGTPITKEAIMTVKSGATTAKNGAVATKNGATATKTEATSVNTRATKTIGRGDGSTTNQASHAEEVHPDITSLLFQGLCELQKVYDNKENRGENSIMIIEEDWFQKHANLIQQARELSKEPHSEPYDERISNIQRT